MVDLIGMLRSYRAMSGAVRHQTHKEGITMRNLKALGLALVAIFALSAVVASAAMASGEKFHAAVEPSVITSSNAGEGNHVFKAGEAEVVCTQAEFSGTSTTKTSESQTVHPTYRGCTFLGGKATVDTTGCNYVLYSSVPAGGHGKVEIECEGTNKIKVTGPGCTLTFGAQVTEGGAFYKNLETNPKTTTVSSTTNAAFTKSGLLCGAVTGTVGTYTGSVITKTYEDKCTAGECPFVPARTAKEEEEGFTTTDKDAYTEGAQVDGWWE
jgi:hypothetical protein